MHIATEFLQGIFVLLMAVVFHEYAHGWAANKLGDPTAKMAGRLTLNPLKHIDPVGMFIVPVLTKLLAGFTFGWAKPVPVNFALLRDPKRDMIWVGLAGPSANLALALLLSLLLPFSGTLFFTRLLAVGILINLVLGIFNLLPIPPLDGSRVAAGLLPESLSRGYRKLEPFGLLVVVVLIRFGLLDFVWDIAAGLAFALGVNVGKG